MTERVLLRTREAAEALAVSEREIRYLVARGELAPVVRIGRALRIPVATVRSFAERRAADSAPRSA